VADPSRFAIVARLEPLRGFRRALAVDRERERGVVVETAPPEVASDPTARAALLARAGAASALRHPGVAAVLGAIEVEGALAVLEEHRPGVTLRELLDAAGRLPTDVAARAVLDAAEGLARAHAVDSGAGSRLAHGAVDPATVVVGEQGAAFVCGLGLVAGAEPWDDVRALGAVLHECLAGEPAGRPPQRLELPGLPASLAAVVDRSTGADGPPFPSIAALAEAVAAAIVPATHPALAAYADAVVQPDEGARAALRGALAAALRDGAIEVSAELVVDPEPLEASAPSRSKVAAAAADAVRTFAAPAPPRASARLPIVIGVIALAVGFAVGFLAQRAADPPAPSPVTTPAAVAPVSAPLPPKSP